MDFLLVEYGFVLPEDRWDKICLDGLILPNLKMGQKVQLEYRGFLGQYVLENQMVCQRTRTALLLLCRRGEEWKNALYAEDEVETSPSKVDVLLIQLPGEFLTMIEKTLGEVRKLQVGQTVQRKLLERRWKQMESMVGQAAKCLQNSNGLRTYI